VGGLCLEEENREVEGRASGRGGYTPRHNEVPVSAVAR
jgi:hypothetical protein